ncbi:PGAP1-like protein-domain-containing protein [Cyathus striatus]|nr:PGAP1-like protein-domain-containing protein [Cyathus striatus]
MPPLLSSLLGIASLVLILFFYISTIRVAEELSPQGCRMSWMSPSYVLQDKFNASWTPLAHRYSLWLYREVSWDAQNVQGVPVLFIPGNAGSSHQVRSIASSATRQFYSQPGLVSPEFSSRTLKPLDFFAVEFNEDLSAFHGPTLDLQTAYTKDALSYILSLYPTNTQIIIIGHSMGGVVAVSLLPSKDISAVITMSTPHTLPPARFDSRIDSIYERNQKLLLEDGTPVLSLCGGATDMMIPSESCLLPPGNGTYRSTLFTSALEGAWTGVGHREMVWCHQVRWRVARAALELGLSITSETRADILDKWLRDGHTLPPGIEEQQKGRSEFRLTSNYQLLPADVPLVIKKPKGTHTYLLPFPRESSVSSAHFTLLVSQGSVEGISPHHSIPLTVSVFDCSLKGETPHCTPKVPDSLKLIPNPIPGKTFPVPTDGSDESEGVVLYEVEVDIRGVDDRKDRWLAVNVAHADERGWVLSTFLHQIPVIDHSSMLSTLLGGINIPLPGNGALSTQFSFPRLISHALVVYRVTPIKHDYICSDPFPPLLMHTSHSAETHYFPLFNTDDRVISLHTHFPAPYITWKSTPSHGLNFTIIWTGNTDCTRGLSSIHVSVDWTATVGRWAPRYINTLISWATAVSSLVVFYGWTAAERNGTMPPLAKSITYYGRIMIYYLLPLSFIVSIIPIRESYYLGHEGQPMFALIGPLLLITASGLVCITWGLLSTLIWFIAEFNKLLPISRRVEKTTIHRTTIVSMSIILLLVFLLIPWQVAFLGCWLLQLSTCAQAGRSGSVGVVTTESTGAVPLIPRTSEDEYIGMVDMGVVRSSASLPEADYRQQLKADNLNHNMHLLLFMSWLLPLAAPVLAVWVRTLLTAGLTSPFNGDHNFMKVAPFLVFTDFASWTSDELFERPNFEKRISARWLFFLISVVGFFAGPRKPYRIFDFAEFTMGCIVAIRIGRRYWGGPPWSSAATKASSP